MASMRKTLKKEMCRKIILPVRRPFSVAIEEESDKIETDHKKLAGGKIKYIYVRQRHSCLARGRYVEQLDLRTKYFPPKQLYPEMAEHFFREPRLIYSEIFTLGRLSLVAITTLSRRDSRAYDPMPKKDRARPAELYRKPNLKLAESYGINMNEWG